MENKNNEKSLIVSKAKFDTYEAVRKSGSINMFDTPMVIALGKVMTGTKLTRDDCLEIMKHYSEYKLRSSQ